MPENVVAVEAGSKIMRIQIRKFLQQLLSTVMFFLSKHCNQTQVNFAENHFVVSSKGNDVIVS